MSSLTDLTAKILGMPPLASSNGKDVDDLIIYVHWLMLLLFITMTDIWTRTWMGVPGR